MSTHSTNSFSRRRFLSHTALGAAGYLLLPSHLLKAQGANSEVRILVIGCDASKAHPSGQGTYHLKRIASGEIKGARIVGVCDADQETLDAHKVYLEKKGITAFYEKDFRKALENTEADAVIIATPNHLHTLVALSALVAGKHVYVEKPVSHNLTEGGLLVKAADHFNKQILQHGMQRRSDPGRLEMWDFFKTGELGQLKLSRGLNFKPRKSIGKTAGPQPTPATLDYNLWSGPREVKPLRRTSVHYDWHWFWEYGNGDIGNQGPHQLDVAIWGTGANALPKGAMSVGGRLGYDDDGETANTQIVVYDYDKIPVVFDNRGLPMKNMDFKLDAPVGVGGTRIGNVFEFENGIVAEGQILDKNGKKMLGADGKARKIALNDGKQHLQNFIDSIHAGKQLNDNLHVRHGHHAAGLAQMANISYRLGKKMAPEEIKERLKKSDKGSELFEGIEKHLADNQIDLKATPLAMGPWLQFDPEKEVFTGDMAEEANKLAIADTYRKEFELPKF